MKKNFAEPEMEVLHFNAQEIVTAASIGKNDDPLTCSNPPAEVKWGD